MECDDRVKISLNSSQTSGQRNWGIQYSRNGANADTTSKQNRKQLPSRPFVTGSKSRQESCPIRNRSSIQKSRQTHEFNPGSQAIDRTYTSRHRIDIHSLRSKENNTADIRLTLSTKHGPPREPPHFALGANTTIKWTPIQQRIVTDLSRQT